MVFLKFTIIKGPLHVCYLYSRWRHEISSSCITAVLGHRNQSSSKAVHNNLILLKNDENDALKYWTQFKKIAIHSKKNSDCGQGCLASNHPVAMVRGWNVRSYQERLAEEVNSCYYSWTCETRTMIWVTHWQRHENRD